MKNEKELNDDIVKITMTIKEKSPELSKYILEMPVTIPDVTNPKINIKILQDYYDSLKAILNNYNENQNLPKL